MSASSSSISASVVAGLRKTSLRWTRGSPSGPATLVRATSARPRAMSVRRTAAFHAFSSATPRAGGRQRKITVLSSGSASRSRSVPAVMRAAAYRARPWHRSTQAPMPSRPSVSRDAAILKASERRVVCIEVPSSAVKPAASSSAGLRYTACWSRHRRCCSSRTRSTLDEAGVQPNLCRSKATESARSSPVRSGASEGENSAPMPYAASTCNHTSRSAARSGNGSKEPRSVVPAVATRASGSSSRPNRSRTRRASATRIRPRSSTGTGTTASRPSPRKPAARATEKWAAAEHRILGPTRRPVRPERDTSPLSRSACSWRPAGPSGWRCCRPV